MGLQPQPVDVFGSNPAPVGGAMAMNPAATNVPQSVIVPAFSHQGLTVEFECSKPEVWNKENSQLIARCKNSAPDTLYGFSLQFAVPKYVIMEMEPPSSTTVPVTGANNSKIVTQKIKVTNTRMGEKSLVLKLKVSFTLQGKKIEHMTTCSGFPI